MPIKRSMSILLTLMLILFTGPGYAKAAPAEPGVKALENKIAELVNKERAKHGLTPLKYVADISDVARVKSQDMVKSNYFSHTSPAYGNPFKMMESFGIRYTAAGENIASGFRSAQTAMSDWMNCPGHKGNILSTVFTQMGVGVAILPNGTYCFTQLLVKR